METAGDKSSTDDSYISIVVPAYKSPGTIKQLSASLNNVLKKIGAPGEIIMIDDNCPDGSWAKILEAHEECEKVKGIRLSRNFGQHNAITAGLSAAKGEWIVVMDCDLQDKPEEIERLHQKALEGYEVVQARRRFRQDSLIKRISSAAFYRLLGFLTETQLDNKVGNYGIYHRKAIQAVLEMNDYNRYFPCMIQWVGFNATMIDVIHQARRGGESSYNIRKLVRLATNTIVSFSEKPLRLAISAGLLMAVGSGCLGIYFLIGHALGAITVPGFTSIIISIWLTAGVNLLTIGIAGLYIGKTYQNTQGRPYYIIRETVG